MTEGYKIPRNEILKRSRPESVSAISRITNLFFGKEISLGESFTISHDDELKYTRYVKGDHSQVDVELLISDEMDKMFGQGAVKAANKRQLREEIANFKRVPYGDKSIDQRLEFTNPKYFEGFSSVNAVSHELESSLGMPIAVKGYELSTGAMQRETEDYVGQFRYMRHLEQQMLKAKENVREVFRVCKVYAVVRYRVADERRYEQWLIMERINNPEHLDITRYHPQLERLVEEERGRSAAKDWSAYIVSILRASKIILSDVMDNNLIFSADDLPDKRKYVIIDQRPQEKFKTPGFETKLVTRPSNNA